MTTYAGHMAVPMKVFIVERMTSLALAMHPQLIVRVHNPFTSPKRIYKLPFAVINDALKIAYRTEGHGQYLQVFELLAALRAYFNLQIRLGAFLGVARIRRCLRVLAAYWPRGED